MSFGPINAPPFYTALVCRFQDEWMHLPQPYYNNSATNVKQITNFPKKTTTSLPNSGGGKIP